MLYEERTKKSQRMKGKLNKKAKKGNTVTSQVMNIPLMNTFSELQTSE
jgi:hypothetical protein